MPALERRCPDCGNKLLWNFDETVLGERLAWYASSRCDHCGYAQEEDHDGPLPNHLRDIVLSEQGRWSLQVEETSDQKVLILKSLREALSLSLPEAANIKELIPGVVRSGTQAEMKRLRVILIHQGIRAVVVPFKDNA